MYAEPRQAMERHRDKLAQADNLRQVSRLRALRRASRKVERAERRLVEAQSDALRVRSILAGGS
jgi:hypothetical protein